MKNIFKLKRVWLLILFPLGLLISFIAQEIPSFAEWYSKTIYFYMSRAINFITSLVPFSVAEIIVYCFILLVLIYIVKYILKLVKNNENRKDTTIKFILNIVCFGSVLYFMFIITCSINYSRFTFAQTCGLEVKPSTKAELIELCNTLADEVNTARQSVNTNNENIMRLSSSDIYASAKEAQKSFDKINSDYPLLYSGYGQPKPVFSSRLMSYCNITGIFFPFTFESNVNIDVPDYSIPSTMCHELAHLRGYMREDEANFIGYLVCKKSKKADFQYSGKMLAFINASNALFSVDYEEGKKVYSKLSKNVITDLINNSTYWQNFEGPVAKTAEKINDNYLKANNQQDGVKSYGRMVDLLLAEYRKNK